MTIPFQKIKLSLHPGYWRLRNSVRLIAFVLRRRYYKLAEIKYSSKTALSRSLFFFAITLTSCIPALFLNISILACERYCKLIGNHYWNALPPYARYIYGATPVIDYSTHQSDLFAQLLIVIASIAGLLLGLYYPMLATVVGASYSKVPSSIARLIMSEPTTAHFSRSAAFLMAFCVITIVTQITGFQPQCLTLLVVTVLSIRLIFMLVNMIGRSLFSLFDPVTLVNLSAKNLYQALHNASRSNTFALDFAFQNHFKNQAREALSELHTLFRFMSDEKYLRGQSLSDSFQQVVALTNYYLDNKVKIPSNSKWYMVTIRHESMLLSNSVWIEPFMSAKALPAPSSVPNHDWFEEELLESIESGIAAFVVNNDISSATTLLNGIREVAVTLGRVAQPEQMDAFLTKIREVIIKFMELDSQKLGSKSPSISHSTYSDSMSALSLLEVSMLVTRATMVGFFDKIESYSVEMARRQLSVIDWKSPVEIYSASPFPQMNTEFELLREQIVFEHEVEKIKVTPDWFILQSIAVSYLSLVKKTMDNVVDLLTHHTVDLVNILEAKGMLIPTVFAAQFSMHHYTWLLERRIADIKKVLEEFEKLQVQTETAVKINYDNWLQVTREANDYFLEMLSKHLPRMSIVKWEEKYPDLFGASYLCINDEINRALALNDVSKSQSLFKQLFGSALLGPERIKIFLTKRGYNDQYQHAVLSQFYRDLLQISGLSLIYADLYNNEELKNACIENWEVLFKEHEDQENGIAEYFVSWFATTRNSVHIEIGYDRTHYRKVRLCEMMRSMGLAIERNPFDSQDEIESRLQGQSELVQILAPSASDFTMITMADFGEVFIEFYVREKYPDAKYLQYKRNVHNAIERLRTRNSTNNSDIRNE